LVASTNESLNSGNGKAVHRREGTTTYRIASILRASVVVVASNVGVSAASSGVATIDCAVSVVVAEIGNVKGIREAAGCWGTLLLTALVSVVAKVLSVDTGISGSVTRVIGTHVLVIAILGSGDTSAIGLLALVDHARNLCADNAQATIACLRRVLAAKGWSAIVLGARIGICAIERSVRASYRRVATWNFAPVSGNASNVGVVAAID